MPQLSPTQFRTAVTALDQVSQPPLGPLSVQTDREAVQLAAALTEVVEWLDLKMTNGRYTLGFAIELARHMVTRTYNVHNIYDEIGKMEGQDARESRTVDRPFDRLPLRGLRHRHHFQARFLLRNLLNETRKMDAESMFAPLVGQEVGDIAGHIAHDMVIGGFRQRLQAARLTGEWIVYDGSPSGNYYLTLALHPSSGKDSDEECFKRIQLYRRLDRELSWEEPKRLNKGNDMMPGTFRATCPKCGAMFDEGPNPERPDPGFGWNARDGELCQQPPVTDCPEFLEIHNRYIEARTATATPQHS